MLTAEKLRQIIVYDPETGEIAWRVSLGPRAKAGERVGYKNLVSGYRSVMIAGVCYQTHRLAWLYMTGAWPNPFIDHKNGIRDDNRWANLREATKAENRQNTVGPVGKSGLVGVTPRGDRWISQIAVSGRKIHLGMFDTPEEASAAYAAAKRNLHTFQPVDRRAA